MRRVGEKEKDRADSIGKWDEKLISREMKLKREGKGDAKKYCIQRVCKGRGNK